jgi:hypothetical protein
MPEVTGLWPSPWLRRSSSTRVAICDARDPHRSDLEVYLGIADPVGRPSACWIRGDATFLPPMQVDLVAMTVGVVQAVVDRLLDIPSTW